MHGCLSIDALLVRSVSLKIAKLTSWLDNLAERSKAPASGAGPKGRGFKSHSCHTSTCENARHFVLVACSDDELPAGCVWLAITAHSGL